VKKELFARGEKELARALDNEVQEQLGCYLSEDCREGIRAFSNGVLPNFRANKFLTRAFPRL